MPIDSKYRKFLILRLYFRVHFVTYFNGRLGTQTDNGTVEEKVATSMKLSKKKIHYNQWVPIIFFAQIRP